MLKHTKNPPLATFLNNNEKEKKRNYNSRVINVEKSTLTTMIFTTFGNMGNECKAVLKHVANLIAVKRGERYADVMGNLTINIRMTLLRCIFLSVRGSRGTSKGTRKPLSSVAFNLIPSGSEQHCLL